MMSAATHTIHRGATGQTVLVAVADRNGDPVTGIDPTEPGIRAGYVRTDGAKGAISMVAGSRGEWVEGGFLEIDPDLAPGVYQLGIPDEVLAPGATRAAIVLLADAVGLARLDIDLVAFDPQEPDRIGLESLAFEQRVKCLTTAFPLLAVEERRRLEQREHPA